MKTDMTRREFGHIVGAAALTAIPGGATASSQNTGPARQVSAGSELCFMSALELAARIRQKQVSAREVMTAHLAQIERINPKVNAIVTLAFMANPAMSVPGGFTSSGLPVGIQIVGRHRDDWSVLQLAHAFEQATEHGRRRPAVV